MGGELANSTNIWAGKRLRDERVRGWCFFVLFVIFEIPRDGWIARIGRDRGSSGHFS